MRTAIATLAAVLAAAGPAAAQAPPYLAEVTAETAVTRTGPSAQSADTGTLVRGTKLVVDHDEGDGWVAVQPPRGQVSWIRNTNIGPVGDAVGVAAALPHNAAVYADAGAELAYGRPGVGKPLDVRRTKVPEGTVVLVIGEKVVADGVTWWPIDPPADDFRYVPKAAIQAVRGQPAQVVVRSPTVEPASRPAASDGGFVPVAASVPDKPAAAGGRPADWPTHPLWRQAEAAEQEKDYAKAETLYLKLAAESNQSGGDAELANLCYARVHSVREKQRVVSRNGVADPPAPPGGPAPAGQWVGPGTVRTAGFRWANRPTFALVGPQGNLKAYAVAGPGVDLERYRGADVDLFGTVEKPGELRGYAVVTVTRVTAARDK